MKYINKYKTTESFESEKVELNKLEHYLAYDTQADIIYLKKKLQETFILNYKVSEEMSSMADMFGGKLPLLSRCDLYKSVKIDGIPQDLSGKIRTPYKFVGGSNAELQSELIKLYMNTDSGISLNEDYIITINYSDNINKEGTIEITFQDNIPIESLIGCMSTNMLINNIPNNLFDNKEFNNFYSIFYNCYSLTSLDLSLFNTSKVTNMSSMFNGCNSLTSLDLSNFDTSNVTYISEMFRSCVGLTSLNLINFDTTKITEEYNMIHMFDGCDKLTYIKCKQAFKDWCWTNQNTIELPTAMRNGGSGTWEIIDASN